MISKLLPLLFVMSAVGMPESGSIASVPTAAALGVSFIDGSTSALILEKDGHKYRIDLVAQTVREVQEVQLADWKGQQSPGGGHPSPGGGQSGAAPDGQAIFKRNCTRCHGEDGKGKPAVGTPDFTNPQTQASITDQEIINTITNGRKGTIMPSWKGTLSPQQIAAVASYVRSLGGEAGKAHALAVAAEPKEPTIFHPGDDFLMSLPTGRRLDRHGVYVNFAHRFALDPAFVGPARGYAMLGLDGFALSSFGFRYGVTGKFSISAYRSPTFISRPIEFMAAYNLISEERHYVNATARVSVQGENDFSRNFTPNFELILSKSVTGRAQFYLVPTLSLFNRQLFQPKGYESFYIPNKPGFNTFSLGAGAAVDVLPTLTLFAEIIPTFANATELGIHRPVYAFGITKKIFRHAFTFGFTTGPGTTVAQRIGTRGAYLGGVPDEDKLFIGFNIMRQLF